MSQTDRASWLQLHGCSRMTFNTRPEDREGGRVAYEERQDGTPTRQTRTILGIDVGTLPPHGRAFKQTHDRLADTDGTEIPGDLLRAPLHVPLPRGPSIPP